MRDTVIGVVLAAAFVAAIFAASYYFPHSGALPYVQAAADVQPGFEGAKRIGPWQFVCTAAPAGSSASKAAIPFMLNPNPHGGAAAMTQGGQSAYGRCRTSLIYGAKNNPKAAILVVTFRTADSGQHLAMLLHFGAIAKQGDAIVLRLPNGGSIKIPVTQCAQNICTAGGILGPKVQNLILGTAKGVLVFPPMKDGKALKVLVPFVALKEATDAMRRAES